MEKGVRSMYNLPYTAHRWILGPLLNQSNIRIQLHRRTACFLHGMSTSCNKIVSACFSRAVNNANTPIGRNLAYIRNCYGFNISEESVNNCRKLIIDPRLSAYELGIVRECNMLLLARSGVFAVDGFSIDDINVLISLLTTT